MENTCTTSENVTNSWLRSAVNWPQWILRLVVICSGRVCIYLNFKWLPITRSEVSLAAVQQKWKWSQWQNLKNCADDVSLIVCLTTTRCAFFMTRRTTCNPLLTFSCRSGQSYRWWFGLRMFFLTFLFFDWFPVVSKKNMSERKKCVKNDRYWNWDPVCSLKDFRARNTFCSFSVRNRFIVANAPLSKIALPEIQLIWCITHEVT